MIKKKNTYNFLICFLIIHLLTWTLVPFFSNINLPLDVIEALAWGSNLEWGFEKHPPLSAFFTEVFYKIFGNQDWAYYLLSQLFVTISFYVVWSFSNEFFKDRIYSLISVLLLESIYFYNFTSPEFNVNICQLPFWALSIHFCWLSLKNDKTLNWILFGFFAALGVLSKYLFIYLLFGQMLYIIFFSNKKNLINLKFLIPVFVFVLLLFPHFLWLVDNDYKTIMYGIKRSSLENSEVINHLIFPVIFLIKQVGILLPLFLLSRLMISKFKIKINLKDKKLLYLLSVAIIPIFLVFLTSFLAGAKIRTMWMTPFYLFLGVLIVYIFQKKIKTNNLKNFYLVFLSMFILSPILYTYVSLSNDSKRTDYPGSEISYLVQNKWNKNFSNEIGIIVGDEWFGGNLSYHLKSRPKWYNSIDNKINKIDKSVGVIYLGNPKILKEICPGVFGTLKPVGVCMIGKK